MISVLNITSRPSEFLSSDKCVRSSETGERNKSQSYRGSHEAGEGRHERLHLRTETGQSILQYILVA